MFHGPHRYLRAYLAGIAFPTIMLIVIVTTFVSLAVSGVIEWTWAMLMIFPMAVVPNLWGLWNVAFIKLSESRKPNIGLHGAVLPLLIAPTGYLLARLTGHELPFPMVGLAAGVMLTVLGYYLIWKYIVSYLNESLDLEEL